MNIKETLKEKLEERLKEKEAEQLTLGQKLDNLNETRKRMAQTVFVLEGEIKQLRETIAEISADSDRINEGAG